MTMPTLTDRYVSAVARAVPEAQRADLGAEIRERVADAVDARLDAGDSPAEAERTVLNELGDPDRLAATYLGRSLQLIGPRYYLTWWRLLKLLLAIVPASVAGAIVIAFAIDGRGIGEIIGGAASITATTTVHLVFWTTLVFAIIERTSPAAAAPELDEPWTVDRLPEPQDAETRLSRGGAIAEAVLGAAFVAFLIAQQFNPFLHAPDGTAVPLLDPSLWSWFLPYLIVIAAADIAANIAIYLHGRYAWWTATIGGLLSLAFTVPSLWLWSTGRLVNPEFLTIFPETDSDWMRITGIVVGLVWAGIVVWDIIDGFRKARRAERERL